MSLHRSSVLALLGILLCVMTSCHRPSRADQMRRDIFVQDSLQYVQALRTRAYSDSLLQTLLPQVDPLLNRFRFENEEAYEDHGRYVHRLLVTDRNTARNYLQAYVTDDARLVLQSFYYGSQPIDQRALRIAVDEGFQQAEGTNHRFEAEGWHELLTLTPDDSQRLLDLVASHTDERVRVSLIGKREQVYYLQTNEKQALAETLQLAKLMQDIATLERSIHTADRQIEKHQRKYGAQETPLF